MKNKITFLFLMLFWNLGFSQVLYVTPNGAGNHSGSNWSNAIAGAQDLNANGYTDLRDAIVNAASGTQIWVAAGTYLPTLSTDRSKSFTLKSGVQVYGGFAGGETLLSQRNLVTNICILSGDIGTIGVNTDNSYHVIFLDGAASGSILNTALLDGFTVSGGYNEDQVGYPGWWGAGILLWNNYTTINISPVFQNIKIQGNDGKAQGSAVCVINDWNVGANMSPNFINCLISSNKSYYSPVILSDQTGGGIGTITFFNCTMSGNYDASSYSTGSGMGTVSGGNSITLTNCILFNNLFPTGSAEVSNATVTYSDISGGYTGTGNINADPLFLTAATPSTAPAITGNFHLQACSPAYHTGTSSGAPSTDIELTARGALIDIGAYVGTAGPALPSIPVATAASAVTSTSFTANWNASTGATKYYLDVALDNLFTTFVSGYNNLDVGNVTSYNVSGLSSGNTYYYRVRAYNCSGSTTNSNIISQLLIALGSFGNTLNFVNITTNQWVDCGNNANLNLTNNFTLEAWFYPIPPLGSNWNTIMAKELWNTNSGYLIYLNGGHLYFSNGNYPATWSNAVIPNNAWTHVAVSYNAGIASIYINGSLDFTIAMTINQAASATFYIGCRHQNSGTLQTDFFHGNIDEVSIWNTALSQAQIQANMGGLINSATASNLISYYRFDQGNAGNNNTTLPNELVDYKSCNKGTLNGFSLTGSSCNWISTGTNAAPIVGSTSATPGLTSATVAGNIFSVGTANATKRGVCYNVTGCPFTTDTKVEETGSFNTGAFNENITGLSSNMLYYARAYAINATGTTYGETQVFTTLPTTFTVTGGGSYCIGGSGVIIGLSGSQVGVSYQLQNGIVPVGSPLPGTGSSLSWTNITGTGTYTIIATNAGGSSNMTGSANVTGIPIVGPAGPISGPTQVCQGGCGYVYSVTIPNATGYIWTVPVGGSITAGANTNTITVCYALNSVPGYVYVYGTAACGNGAPSQLAVAMNPPATPTIAGPFSVCVNSTNNVYTTQPGFNNYIWTVSAGGTVTAGGGVNNNTITITWSTVGAKTVSVNYNTAAGCSALTPNVYNVTVNPLPVPTISGPSPACSNYPGLVYSTQAGMTSYTWNISGGGTITSGAGTNSITVTWNAAGAQNISVNYTNTNGCTASAPVVYPVTVNSGASPTISGSNNLCVNSGYYNYTTETGMTAYNWTVSAGGVINYGSGTNVITVSWITSGAQWVMVNYTNPTGCSAINPTQLNITVNPLPGPTGPISGAATVCGGTAGTAYSVAPVSGAATYIWYLPIGDTIASGGGTNSITVNFAPNGSSGNITVYANNKCGNGTVSPPFAITVNPLPAPAGNISGPDSVCEGETSDIYTVPVIFGATGYTWTVPVGVVIKGGANTNSITVNFSTGAVSGNVTVYGTNTCGNGTVSPNFAVTVNAIPVTPVASNTGDTLHSSAPTGNQWYFEGTLITGATSQKYVATQNGLYWTIVTINGCSSAESNHKQIYITGIDKHSSASINVYPVPNDGLFTASITTTSSQSFTITVYNNLGVKIYTEANVEVDNTINKAIDLRPVPNGVYTVIFENSQNQVVKKIVINK